MPWCILFSKSKIAPYLIHTLPRHVPTIYMYIIAWILLVLINKCIDSKFIVWTIATLHPISQSFNICFKVVITISIIFIFIRVFGLFPSLKWKIIHLDFFLISQYWTSVPNCLCQTSTDTSNVSALDLRNTTLRLRHGKFSFSLVEIFSFCYSSSCFDTICSLSSLYPYIHETG